MPGVYAGGFSPWEEAQRKKRPSDPRVKLLKKWVDNLIRAKEVRRTGCPVNGPWCGVAPYHHFTSEDMALLRQIANDSDRYSDVDEMVSRMVKEYELAVKERELLQKLEHYMAEMQTTETNTCHLEAQLSIQQQTLAELKEALDQQKMLQIRYSLEIQRITDDLETERKKGYNLKVKMNDARRHPPDEYCDMIFTCVIMKDPVVAADGFTYDREAIQKWFKEHRTSPTTGALLTTTNLIPNNSLKSQINQWMEKNSVGATIDKSVIADSTGAVAVAGHNPHSVTAGAVVGHNPHSVTAGAVAVAGHNPHYFHAAVVGSCRIIGRLPAR